MSGQTEQVVVPEEPITLEGFQDVPPEERPALPLPGDYVTPDDFASLEDYEAYIQAHPEAETGVGAQLEVGLTGIRIVGDYWFIGAVLLFLPLAYFLKKKIDYYFAKKHANIN